MIRFLDPENSYLTEDVELHHSFSGSGYYPTLDSHMTGSLETALERGNIPTRDREGSPDEEFSEVFEDMIRLAGPEAASGFDDPVTYLEENEEHLREHGQGFTRDLLSGSGSALEILEENNIIPDDIFNTNTVHLFEDRSAAIDSSRDKKKNVGGVFDVKVPEECVIYVDTQVETEPSARVIGPIPLEFVDAIYLGTEDQRYVSEVEGRVEQQGLDINVDCYPPEIENRWGTNYEPE